MLVTRSAHEDALRSLGAQLDAQGIPESAGIHGPDSIAWRINAEVSNFLGAGAAVLLQLAHPYVAYGISQHSMALTDVRQRFVGTFESIYRMTFGTRAEAFASARTIHQVHARIHGPLGEALGRYPKGHRYHANEAEALQWVHATLVSTAMRVHQVTGLRLGEAELAEFYEASKRFALLFGLQGDIMPADLAEFRAYVREYLAGDSLVVSTPARDIARYLLTAPIAAAEPAFVVYRAITAKFLGRRLSHAYGLPYGRGQSALAGVALRASSPLRSLSPAALRLVPNAMRAESRLGVRGPSRLSPWLEKALHRGLGAWPSTSAEGPEARGADAR